VSARPRFTGLSIPDVRIGLRFLASLPRFLRTPFGLAHARETLARRLAERETRFLALVQRWIFERQESPYRRLLMHAGCEPGDLTQLVRSEGVDGALARLFANGVYLSCSEFKGRTPVERGSLSFTIEQADLVRPDAVVHGLSESSGSRGAPTAVPIDLAFIRDHAINTHLSLQAHDGAGWTHAHWGVPGGTSVTNTLEFAVGGSPPERWFTPVSLKEPGLHPRYRLGTRAMRIGSLLSGVPLPPATLAPLDDPMPVVRWARHVLARGDVPHVWTFASSAVLVCEAAKAAGVDISGARFTAGGEPTTTARRRAIEEVGAHALPRFGATETDIIAFACREPEAPDEQHFFHDRHAVIQSGPGNSAGLPQTAILLTSLLRSAPVLMLNVSMGDQAELSRRQCGCAMGALGWHTHIHRIRSFEKLTAGGIQFLDVDVIRVLEEVLPARFGGTPMDYQLVEDPDGEATGPRVRLFVHPELGPLDPTELAEVFLSAIGGGDSGERLMELQWRGAGVLQVERQAPLRTGSGKILHLYAG
jgi:hypothetical protein